MKTQIHEGLIKITLGWLTEIRQNLTLFAFYRSKFSNILIYFKSY